MALRIEDYAIIGDCRSAALIGRDGSADWLCWPRFDSGACFAALLGTPEHGRWLIAAADPNAKATRRYRDDTLILETDFETPGGAVTLIDFMPVAGEASHVARIVIGRRGQLAMRCELVLRFDYGSIVPWVTRLDDGTLEAVAGPDMVLLRTPIALHGEQFKTAGDFTVSEGQTISFVLTYGRSHRAPPEPIDPIAALSDTEAFWRNWSAGCTGMGEWSGLVRRSLITLKALTYQPTGGIVAAATASLPEQLGGTRNWDYRYCWIRDATLTLLSLMHSGFYQEALDWRLWLQRAVAGLPAQAQIMYGVAGERRLPELVLPWLPGYQGAAPVRIGNAASDQCQLDIYGEMLDAYYQGRRGGLPPADLGSISSPFFWTTSLKSGAIPTKGSGRFGASPSISPTRRSWPGLPLTGRSSSLRISAFRGRSNNGRLYASQFTARSARRHTMRNAVPLCSTTAPRHSTQAFS